MITVSVQEAERDFASLLRRVMSGEEIVISSEDKEVAIVSPLGGAPKPRVPGSARGSVTMSPDFDEPLPDDVMDEFER